MQQGSYFGSIVILNPLYIPRHRDMPNEESRFVIPASGLCFLSYVRRLAPAGFCLRSICTPALPSCRLTKVPEYKHAVNIEAGFGPFVPQLGKHRSYCHPNRAAHPSRCGLAAAEAAELKGGITKLSFRRLAPPRFCFGNISGGLRRRASVLVIR